MPKEKETTRLIAKIYKKNFENTALFVWVNAQKQIVPTVTLEQAIWSYFKYFDIDWDIESAMVTYVRMQKEFYEDTKTDC